MKAFIRVVGLLLIISSAAAAQQISPPSDGTCGVAHSTTVNWSQFLFDSCHSGYNPYETILGPANVGNLVLDWTFESLDEVFTPPAVVDGTAYFGSGSGDGYVYAVDASTGNGIWQNRCGRLSDSVGPPAVANGRVFVACVEAQTIRAISAATGQLLWEERDPFGDIPISEITVSGGIVYASSYHMGNYSAEHLYALDASTGAVLWKISGEQWGITTPAVANGLVYVQCSYGSLCAFDALTGVLRWQYTAEGSASISAAAVVNGVAYFESVSPIRYPSNLMYLYAVNATTGAFLWVHSVTAALNSTQDDRLSTPAVANGVVYFVTEFSAPPRGRLYAVDASTGGFLWQDDYTGNLTPPLVANGVVYFGRWNYDYFKGTVYAADSQTGATLWQYTFDDGAGPGAVVNGTLYVVTHFTVSAFHLPD